MMLMRILLLLAAVGILPAPALAWSGEGHQIVGAIAENRLTPAALEQVRELLGPEAWLSDAEVANWADEIRRQRRDTAPYHFVNIPADADGYDPKRDDPRGEHIVSIIERFAGVLADRSKPKAERAEALKFLVHPIGDLHQPLHVIERNGDRGGNRRLVFFRERKTATNLHRVWDFDLVRQYVGRGALWEYVETLDAAILPRQVEVWERGTSAEWATESHRMAPEHVYRDIPADGPPPKIGNGYVLDRRGIVESELQRAGVRLAVVLNRAIGDVSTSD